MNQNLGATIVASVLACAALSLFSGRAEAAEPAKERGEGEAEVNPKKKLLWLEAQGGVQNANLNTFNANFSNFSVGFLPRSGIGPAADVGAGVRLVFVTLGVRGRVARFDDSDSSRNVSAWTMSSLNGEIGFRAPLGRLEPYMALSAGYTTLGGFSDAIRGAQNGFNVNGFNTRVGLGMDYFVSRHISLGGLLSGELLALTRPGIPIRDVAALPASSSLDVAAVRLLEANGSTYGTALTLSGGLKAHF